MNTNTDTAHLPTSLPPLLLVTCSAIQSRSPQTSHHACMHARKQRVLHTPKHVGVEGDASHLFNKPALSSTIFTPCMRASSAYCMYRNMLGWKVMWKPAERRTCQRWYILTDPESPSGSGIMSSTCVRVCVCLCVCVCVCVRVC